ncbi:acylphosphatase-2-like isoform X1 [Pseudoliparis swirei]|uniref:acylphosphatase-2-like isoform X1 n=2 Tax=Pseudoliparis swirei TaxID=2059687 RepID=UPI0024BD9277|nr:acylphosphatase-2-like isoform X1 [Pseudoliparis swirei]
MSEGRPAGTGLVSVDFEISGHVQGVCFRMYEQHNPPTHTPACLQYTEKKGLQLGLVGWVRNTYHGTVEGQVQGPATMVEDMKVWLSKEGSPTSRITKASFANQRTVDTMELSGFKTRF